MQTAVKANSRDCRTTAGWETQTALSGEAMTSKDPVDISDELAPLRRSPKKQKQSSFIAGQKQQGVIGV